MTQQHPSAPGNALITPAEPSDLAVAVRVAQKMLAAYGDPSGFSVDAYARAHGALSESLRILLHALGAQQQPAEELISGTRPCGHDDYHDAHEWAAHPHIWCPGILTDTEAARRSAEGAFPVVAAFLATERGERA